MVVCMITSAPRFISTIAASASAERSSKQCNSSISKINANFVRRNLLASSIALTLSWSGILQDFNLRHVSVADAAILEADDDVELLEKVKNDRKKRLARQGVISSSGKETDYLQDLVYKLSKVGQAIENNDLSMATNVLGLDMNAGWVKNANTAFNKLSSSPEEKSEVEAFNSSLESLFSSVKKQDVESSKLAFVSSASALEKWVGLAGLVGKLKGL